MDVKVRLDTYWVAIIKNKHRIQTQRSQIIFWQKNGHFTTFYLNLSHLISIDLNLSHFTKINLPHFTSFDLFQKKNPAIGIRTAQKILKQLGCGLGTTLASTFNLIASKFYGLS